MTPDHIDKLFANLPTHLTVGQLADVLGAKEKTAYRWLNEGKIPAYRVAGAWVILRDEVEETLRAGSNRGGARPATEANPYIKKAS